MQKIIQVLHPGLLTTIQDLGRTGFQHIAISCGGAMDPRQMILANQLVGNLDTDAGMEITGYGPTLHFPNDTLIACTGAECSVSIRSHSGDKKHLPTHRPVLIQANSTVEWHHTRLGFRCWIAVAGGLQFPKILHSRSSHLAAGIGKPILARGDKIPLGEANPDTLHEILTALQKTGLTLGSPYSAGRWRLKASTPESWPIIHLPVLKGRHFSLLSDIQAERTLQTLWHIDPQSNRQGIRLNGPPVLLTGTAHIPSEPVRQGTVQLPPDGFPILLSCEHQTTGGYPRILEIPGCFTHLLAHVSPSSRIRFRLTSLDEVDTAAIKMNQEWKRIRQSLSDRLQP